MESVIPYFHILNSIDTFLKLQHLAKDLSIAHFLGAINIYPFLFSEVSTSYCYQGNWEDNEQIE